MQEANKRLFSILSGSLHVILASEDRKILDLTVSTTEVTTSSLIGCHRSKLVYWEPENKTSLLRTVIGGVRKFSSIREYTVPRNPMYYFWTIFQALPFECSKDTEWFENLELPSHRWIGTPMLFPHCKPSVVSLLQFYNFMTTWRSF